MIRTFLTAKSAVPAKVRTFRKPEPLRAHFEPLESRSLLAATIITVDTFDDVVDPDDGLTSLREAVLAANASPDDEEIHLAAGTYELTIKGVDNTALAGDLDILDNGSLKIVGAGADLTTIDANDLFGIFDVRGATFGLEGVTLTHGQATLAAGAIFATDNAEVAIADCTLTDNIGVFGGAVSTYFGTGAKVTIIRSTLSQNVATFGGGVGINANSDVTIIDSVISGNETSLGFGDGGGVFNDGGKVSISGTTFLNNTAKRGGAVFSHHGETTITDSVVSGNSSWYILGSGAIAGWGEFTIARSSVSNNIGSGIANVDTMTIIDTLVSGNLGLDFGGGIVNSGTMTIINSTVSGNSTAINGGGISNNATLTVRHSTITGNRGDSDGNNTGLGGGVYLATGSSTIFENTIVAGNVSGAAPGGTPSDIEGVVPVDSTSSYNLVGDPATAGGLAHGTNGNIVGDGSGNPLDINTVLDTTLRDNGGPTLTHALVAGSPAINAGDPNFAPPPDFDQRGEPFVRVFGGRIDIGVFEVQTATLQHMVHELHESGSLTRTQAYLLEIHLRMINLDRPAGVWLANVHLNAFMRQVGQFVRRGILSDAEGQMLLEAAQALRDSFPSRPSPAAVDLALLQMGNWLTAEATLDAPLQTALARTGSILAKVKP